MQIKDLTKDLDSKAMTAVHGGDNGNAATNTIGQALNLSVPGAFGVAGPANTNVNVDGTQNAYIDNFQFAGDSFMALLPLMPVLRG